MQTWTSENFGIKTKKWSETDVIINFHWVIQIYKLHHGLNRYPEKFGSSLFLRHPILIPV